MMNANMVVDMGAAILCSIEKAKQLGIEEGKWVYPYAGVQGYDHFSASVRDNFVESPGVRITGRRVMDLACTTAEELEYVDLYSCFPSAVQVAAKELGLSEDRPLTVTGGLTFGGGPLNNYVMHSVARTVELLRANQERRAWLLPTEGIFISTCTVSMVLSLLHRISNLRTCNKRLMRSCRESAWLTMRVG